jgi:hypothetical protein
MAAGGAGIMEGDVAAGGAEKMSGVTYPGSYCDVACAAAAVDVGVVSFN